MKNTYLDPMAQLLLVDPEDIIRTSLPTESGDDVVDDPNNDVP